MKVQLTIAALIGLVALGITRAPLSADGAQAAKTIWDGVYTEEQATRGAAAYEEHCSTCHLADLAGGGDGIAPSLAGEEFLKFWDGKTMAELFEKTQLMPPGMESTVTDEQRADVIAHVLSYNKVPAGTTELAADSAALKDITITATQ